MERTTNRSVGAVVALVSLLVIMPMASVPAGAQVPANEDLDNVLDSLYCGGTRLDGQASQAGVTAGTGLFVETEPACQTWVAHTDAGEGKAESASGVVYAADGEVIVTTGRSWSSSTSGDIFTVGRDSTTGDEIWSHAYDLAQNFDSAVDLVADPGNDRVYVLGQGRTASFDTNMTVLAYDAGTGTLLWDSQIDLLGDRDDPTALAISADGSTLVAVEMATDPTFQRDYGVISVDPASGQVLWTATYAGAAGFSDVPTDVAVSPDGSLVAVTGTAVEGSSQDITTVAFDDQGSQRWSHVYDGSQAGTDRGQALAITPDGQRVIVAGQEQTATDQDHIVLGLSAGSGAQLWATNHDAGSSEVIWGLAISPDGSSAVAAGMAAAGNWDATAVGVSTADGSIAWATSFDGNQEADEFLSIAFSPAGDRLMAGGTTTEDGDRDLLIASLDPATGQLIWTDRLGGYPGSFDRGEAVAVSPDGSQVALGASLGTLETDRDQAVSVWYTNAEDALLGGSGPAGSGLSGACQLVFSQTLCDQLFSS